MIGNLAKMRNITFPTNEGYVIDENLYSLQNFYGDMIGVAVSFIIWIPILIAIELKACRKTHPKSGGIKEMAGSKKSKK
jgi:hypothetical protein